MSNFMKKLKNVKWKHYINYIAIAIVLVVFGSLSVTGGLPSSTLYLLEKISISIILAVSLSLVVGFLGELSLGHAGFMCVGAYLGGKVAEMLTQAFKVSDNNMLVFIIALIVGGACAGMCGFIVGLPALRLKGDYLAIVTLAFGEIVKVIFQNSSKESFGGPMGLGTPRFDKKYLFIIGFVLVLATVAVIQNLIRSKHGRAITAIRDNEIAARASGINVTKYKLMGFIIAAIFAGLAGVIFSYSQNNISSSPTFDYNYSIEILVMVVLGGMGNISGSILSATLITFLNIQLQDILKGDLAVLKDLLYALILIVIVIYNNAPKLKNFRDKYSLGNLWRKLIRLKHGQSGDDTARWDVVPTKISMDEVLSTDVVIDNTGDNSADIGERGGNK